MLPLQRLFSIVVGLMCALLLSWNAIAQDATSVIDVDWHPDGILLAQLYDDGLVEVRDTLSGQVTFSAQPISVVLPSARISWSHDGTKLAVGIERFVYIWNIVTGQQIHQLLVGEPDGVARTEFGVSTDAVHALEWDSTDSQIVAVTLSLYESIWNTVTGEEILRQTYGNIPEGLDWDPFSNRLSNGKRFLDASTGENIRIEGTSIFPGQSSGPVSAVNWVSDGGSIAYATILGYVVVVDPVTGNELAEHYFEEVIIKDIAWNPSGTLLATVDMGGTLRIIHPDTGDVLHNESIDGQLYGLSWHPDGDRVAYAGGTSDGQPVMAIAQVPTDD